MTGPITELDRTERILLGAGAVAWLCALGAAVAAVVALLDLARGNSQGAESADTPWLLYTVIGISVVVIVAAVPLLLRARAQADNRQPVRSPARRPAPPSRFGYDRAAAAVEEVWLRFTLAMTCAIGVATAAIGLATYLMATDSDVVAWCLYGVAGLITVGMVALPVLALRQLDQVSA
ncbi:DUF2561 family protein [Mycolicibacterium sp. XJ870]